MPKKEKIPKKKKDKERPKFDVHSEAVKAIWGVALIVFFFLSILAFTGKAGVAGRVFAHITESILGAGRMVVPIALLGASYILFTSSKRNSYVPLAIGGFLFFAGVLGMLNIISPQEIRLGGNLGYLAAAPLTKLFGEMASAIIFFGIIAASLVIVFNVRMSKLIQKIRERKEMIKMEEAKKGGVLPAREREDIKVKTWQEENREIDAKQMQDISLSSSPRPLDSSDRRKSGDASVKPDDKDFALHDLHTLAGDFRLPPLELLEKETGKPSSGDIVANANIIKRTLQNFGIEVEMGEVNVGPTVTQFTLKPAEGVKLSRIMGLNNDLSLALAAYPIRIEAPIPGRSLVGIEIPNKGFTIVRLKNLLESEVFKTRIGNLTISLGRDVTGAPIIANLAKMPHLLIAGSTGSGKTICLNVVILSLLYQNSPNALKFILIDPKRVEFPVYSDIPHLLASVVVETQKTVNALKWAVGEMERRFEVLADAKARDIGSFNSNKKVVAERGLMPYIVIVIDELADIMAARGKEVEALIVRLAQMARAVGIHLVLATQRPSVEVITGLIKANITSRIAFQVASQIDSRTVLDMAGAEKLLGNGDMLYLAGDASKPKRVQGAYATEKEVRRVADYLREEGVRLKEQEGEGSAEEKLDFSPHGSKNSEGRQPQGMLQTPDYKLQTAVASSLTATDGNIFDLDYSNGGDSDDELYEEAKKLVIQSQKASSSLLQRRLKVGYARAARLVDMLEENGIVGPGEGAKPREVYMPPEERQKEA